MIRLASKPGDTVCDPFMGSGTTGVVCVREDRKFIGVEREERWFDIACRRIERAWQEKKSELPFDKPPPETQRPLFPTETDQ
jgi:DNA modification methylase